MDLSAVYDIAFRSLARVVRCEQIRHDIASDVIVAVLNDPTLLQLRSVKSLARRRYKAVQQRETRRNAIHQRIVLARIESEIEFDRLESELPSTLTDREREVCHLLASGCSQHDIAEQLNCVQSVISGVVKMIREKF